MSRNITQRAIWLAAGIMTFGALHRCWVDAALRIVRRYVTLASAIVKMGSRNAIQLSVALFAMFAAQSCDNLFGPGGSGLNIQVAGGLEDTVAALPTYVVAEFVPEFHGRAQVVFRYGSTVPSGAPCCVYLIYPTAGLPTSNVVIDTTDTARRAQASLRHGTMAGAQYLVVDARSLDADARLLATDSVLIHTTPGGVAKILIVPRDTAVFTGDSMTLAVSAADYYGNPRAEPVTLAPATSGLTVNGRVVHAVAGPSRQILRAQTSNARDSAWVSIVPRGELAVGLSGQYIGESGDLARVKLDGSGLHPALVTRLPGDYGAQPAAMNVRWNPAGTAVVYQRTDNTTRLFIGDTAGAARPLLYPSPFSAEFNPDFSPDGVWVYFAARSPGLPAAAIWRVHPDGSGLERAPFGPDGSETRPAISPDGQWLAYSSDGYIHVRNLLSGAHTAVNVPGTGPRWSPAGDSIAYSIGGDYAGYSGPVRIVSPDGTGDRQIIADGYAPDLEWTPDGKFVIAKRGYYQVLELIAVATGERVPLPYSVRLFSPAWRP